MEIFYKGNTVGERRVDFFVEGKIIVELKAVIQLEDVHPSGVDMQQSNASRICAC